MCGNDAQLSKHTESSWSQDIFNLERQVVLSKKKSLKIPTTALSLILGLAAPDEIIASLSSRWCEGDRGYLYTLSSCASTAVEIDEAPRLTSLPLRGLAPPSRSTPVRPVDGTTPRR